MAGARLTTEQCQAFADRTMQSLELVGASEALARFDPHVDELVTDDLTGEQCRRIIFATAIGSREVHLTVAVSPEPVIVRRARRFKLIADFMEGWRGSAETGQATKILKR